MRQSGGFCYTELNAYLVKYYKAILSKANLNVAAVHSSSFFKFCSRNDSSEIVAKGYFAYTSH